MEKKRYKYDYHLHGHASGDSTILYRDLFQKAVDRGYSSIAVTEHYDLLDSELCERGILGLRRYFADVEKYKSDFPDLQVYTGLEVGEPHIVLEQAQRLFSMCQPEFLIGSLHVMRDGTKVSLRIDGTPSVDHIRNYYTENLEMVSIGGFDMLGHLGVYKRGLYTDCMPDESFVFSIIDEIFREIIKKNIALEINCSGLKAFMRQIIPDPILLQRYKQLGGEQIVIGSDSHYIEHFDAFYDKTIDILQSIGFSGIYYFEDKVWKRHAL
jgi:histidinol-phosphatase (PHP family)